MILRYLLTICIYVPYWDVTETTVLVVCQLLLAAGKFEELIWIILVVLFYPDISKCKILHFEV